MISMIVNGKAHRLDVEPETPQLWVIRDEIGLTGTKFGCGISMCGACTVHVNGEAVRSCGLQVGDVAGKNVITIEGLSPDSKHPVQQAWLAEDVPQCNRACGRQCGVRGDRHTRAFVAAQECEIIRPGLTAASID